MIIWLYARVRTPHTRHHTESMRKAAELNSDYAVDCGKENTACAAIRGNQSDVYMAYYGNASFTPKRIRE